MDKWHCWISSGAIAVWGYLGARVRTTMATMATMATGTTGMTGNAEVQIFRGAEVQKAEYRRLNGGRL